MKILLTGATGYIGKRLLPVLIEQGHEVICCVGDKNRFPTEGIYKHPNVSLLEVDFLKDIQSSGSSIIKDTDSVYYLIHSMSSNVKDFGLLEEISANNFIKLIKQTSVKQIIYLDGITNEEKLSKHLSSRKRVEEILSASGIPLTSIKAGIIVGSGSASFEIIRDFVEKLPVMTPRLSSYWLYFVTSTSYMLAINLVNSMKVEVVAKDNELEKLLGIKPVSYKEAVQHAFLQIEQNNVVSSLKDFLVSSYVDNSLLEHINVPTNGCYFDKREKEIITNVEQVLNNLWSIGGERGWYYADWLWHIRGFLDKLVGGVGLRRGRTNTNEIHTGDTLDFWRVLAADKQNKRLLLYAEMKLPGEAWLEFKIAEKNGKNFLQQTAIFRPKGLLCRLYWFSILPFHYFMFEGMAENVAKHKGSIN